MTASLTGQLKQPSVRDSKIPTDVSAALEKKRHNQPLDALEKLTLDSWEKHLEQKHGYEGMSEVELRISQEDI